jgi:tetraacyldisaccharide 4'-kinase
MNNWLQQQWYRPGFWHLLLAPLSCLFWLASGLRRFCYRVGLARSYKLPVPVVVVGNISVGGTGKTPLVLWLAEALKRKGLSPAIISRGYGGSSSGVMDVHANSDSAIVGDEPVLLVKRSQCPVWVGRDRVKVAQSLLGLHPECNVIISDDGLQYYRLQRDFEIAVVDGSRGFGNGWLLPAGPLREPASRLKTLDAVVCNGDRHNGSESALNAFSMQLEGRVFHNLLDPTKTAQTTVFAEKSICAIAGIGNPARFFQQLSGLGLQFKSLVFPDHHAFRPVDLQNIKADAILMTEKDAVKCAAFAEAHCWYLPVNAVVDETLVTRIINKIGN